MNCITYNNMLVTKKWTLAGFYCNKSKINCDQNRIMIMNMLCHRIGRYDEILPSSKSELEGESKDGGSKMHGIIPY